MVTYINGKLVETKKCLPDAVQLLTLCSTGNGWMRVTNLGRYAVSLYDKYTFKGWRAAVDLKKLEHFPVHLFVSFVDNAALLRQGDEDLLTVVKGLGFSQKALPGKLFYPFGHGGLGHIHNPGKGGQVQSLVVAYGLNGVGFDRREAVAGPIVHAPFMPGVDQVRNCPTAFSGQQIGSPLGTEAGA